MREEFNQVNEKMDKVCKELAVFLSIKNRNYGNSALEPISVFSKHITKEDIPLSSILIRLDDKLKRIKNAPKLRKNDIVDIMGYLVLLCIKQDWLTFEDLID